MHKLDAGFQKLVIISTQDLLVIILEYQSFASRTQLKTWLEIFTWQIKREACGTLVKHYHGVSYSLHVIS